jgi:hypothetical protein
MAAVHAQATPLTATTGVAKRMSAGMSDANLGGKLMTAQAYAPDGAVATIYVGLDAAVSSTNFLWTFRAYGKTASAPATGDLFIRSANQSPHDRVFPKDYWFAVDTDGAGWTFGLE